MATSTRICAVIWITGLHPATPATGLSSPVERWTSIERASWLNTTGSMAGIATATYRYRGREITAADILYIGELIAANPGASRRTLSKKLCEAWEWRQPQRRFARHGVPGDAIAVGPR